VLFCDLVGSTALASRLDPEDLREVIGAYHRCVAGTVARFDGFVAKYMGDGVLVYFGYPQAHEDDAERAARAGLALVEAVGRLNAAGACKLEAHVGIATGLVVVGEIIGAGEAQERGVVGETPNLAARLQGAAEPNSVVIASSTRRLLGDLFEYRDLGTITAKGFAEPVRAWEVLHESNIESRFEALHPSTPTPLVGREEEVELLLRRWSQAKRGEGRVVLLSGEPGIGKSRIAAALQERLQSEPHLRLRYFCSPYHSDSALYPVIMHLERAARFKPEDTAAARFGKLETVLAPGSHSAEDVALLAEFLSIPPDGSYTPSKLAPQQKRERTLAALVRQLEGLAEHSPVLMVFEDAHWIDPTSLDLLSLTVERIQNLPVLLLIMFRPEFQPPWIGQPHVTTLTLNRLGRRDGAALVEQIANGKTLPPAILDEIVSRTDGVPLFLEELAKTVLESGWLQERDGQYVLEGALPPLAIPTSLHASLMARLDRLAAVKEVAQIGAVIGREIPYELLAAVSPLGDADLQVALGKLISAELIYGRGRPPQATYTFKHALVQDAAYKSLLRGRRQFFHARIAQALEERFPERAATQPELLAHHYGEAGVVERAIDGWERAGEHATKRSANREAVAHLRKALQLVGGVAEPARADRELHLLLALGPALMTTMTSGAPEVTMVYTRARELAQQTGRSAEIFPTLWGSWLNAFVAGDQETARALVEELFKVARSENSTDFFVQAYHAAWPTVAARGELRAAWKLLEESMPLYSREAHGHHALLYGGHDPGVCGHAFAARILCLSGLLDQALAQNDLALALARELAHSPTIAHALWHAAEFHHLRRNVPATQEMAEATLPLVVEQGSAFAVANATMLRGWALVARGSTEDGLAQLRSGLIDWRATGSKMHGTYRLARAAEAFLIAGHAEEALGLLDEAFGMLERFGERWFEPEMHRLRGEASLLLCTDGHDQAESYFQRALDVAREQGARLGELRAATSLARLWRDQGKRANALDLLAPVYAWFSEGFDTPDLTDAKALLDELR